MQLTSLTIHLEKNNLFISTNHLIEQIIYLVLCSLIRIISINLLPIP
jgi:hypothetical protein